MAPRVWPPLQDVLASFALAIGGFDYRLAIWPSLMGWVLAVVFGFLAARRLVPSGGNLAGAVAVLFIAFSPAQRSYATDTMLESLGAGLSLVVLYAYLVAVQDNSARGREPSDTNSGLDRLAGQPEVQTGRWLGLALTVLFLHKYNYWLLTLLALTATEALFWRCELSRIGRAFLSGPNLWASIRSQLRSSANYALLVVLIVVGVVYVHGDRPYLWNDREVWLFPPYNILQAAYWIVFVRLLVWWRKAGRVWTDGCDVRLRQVIRWHFWPVACWLALPKHFGPFLWFLSPLNSSETAKSSLRDGLTAYLGWAATDYHVTLICASIALSLLGVALLAGWTFRRGGLAVLLLVTIGTLLSCDHPNRKGRFLHSWIPAVWVCAGASAALLVHGRLTARIPRFRPWLSCALLGGLGFAQFANGIPQVHAQEGGPDRGLPSLLDVTDFILPKLAGPQSVAVLPAVGIWPQVQWTFLERYGSFDRLEDHRYAFGPPGEPNRQAFRAWLNSTRVRTLIFIEPLPGPEARTPWEQIPENDLHAELRDVLEEQREFQRTDRREFPRQGCTVTVWETTR